MDYTSTYLNALVEVEIDRPLGTRHPRYDFLYLLNYGFLPGTTAPDGEEIDVYILGVFEPLQKFQGRCIAIIRRKDDDDDKLIVVPDGVAYTDAQILALTEFQERFFVPEVVRE